MKLKRRIFAAAFAAAFCTMSLAQTTYPSQPIRLVVPFAPGGATDIVARLIGQSIAEQLGQPVLVDNRPGAGGNIGASAVAKANPDGYTLLMGTLGTQVTNQFLFKSMPYAPQRDFAPISLAANSPNVLLVNPSLEIKTVHDLVEAARREPGKLQYASTSIGSSPHLSGELFGLLTRTQMMHIPYKGGAPALNDLLGGQVQIMYDNLPSAAAHIQAGKVRALAVTSTTRAPLFPDVPTMAEAGVPGYEVNAWFGLLAPAKTPRSVIDTLQKAVVQALRKPDVQSQITRLGAIPMGTTPAEFAKIIDTDTAKWKRVIKEADVRMD